MKYIFILLLVSSCSGARHTPPSVKTDTTTGHWEYTHDEEMQWVSDSVKTQPH